MLATWSLAFHHITCRYFCVISGYRSGSNAAATGVKKAQPHVFLHQGMSDPLHGIKLATKMNVLTSYLKLPRLKGE